MNWVRIRCAFSALVLVLMAGAARGGVLYWMIDGDASDSFQFAYAQTLMEAGKKDCNADSVVARAYAVDKSTGTRETYDFVGVAAADDAGTSFDGAPVPVAVELSSTDEPDNWIFGVEMGFMDGDGTFTATYCAWDAQGLTYAQLDAMGAIQSNATTSYDRPINVAGATWSEPTPVPEPTGGLLVVLGGAVLLLRRNGHA